MVPRLQQPAESIPVASCMQADKITFCPKFNTTDHIAGAYLENKGGWGGGGGRSL